MVHIVKIRLLLQWIAIFTVLSLWTVIVVKGIPAGSLQAVEASDFSSFNDGPIFIQDGASLHQVTKQELLDYIFTNNFDISYPNSPVVGEDTE